VGTVALAAAALSLSGCWIAPNPHAQPKGPPRLIQDGIHAQSDKQMVIVQSVDAEKRTLTVKDPDVQETTTYKVAADVSNLGKFKAGDKVWARLAATFSIYALRDQLPDAGSPEPGVTTAKVLQVDPSYRLLKLQHPNGSTQQFKTALGAKLAQMESGDDVVIRGVEAVELSGNRFF
jgi:hypothetical protein